MTETTIIEIGGAKLEVDLRHARRIDNIRIGDKVKILTKDYSGHKVSPGVVIGFEPFLELPTIVVAYVEDTWQSAKIKFCHFNKASKDIELVVAADEFDIDRERIFAAFDREVAQKRREIEQIEEHRAYFEQHFKLYWSRVAPPSPVSANT